MNKEKEEPSEDKEDDEVHKARMSLWTAMQHHFSSEPIHFTGDTYPQLVKSSTRNALTVSEVAYLHSLLKSDNLDHLNCAVRRLSDHNVFVPSTTFVDVATEKTVVQPTESVRRDSFVQQHLFRLHEATNHRPSTLMRRLSIKERDRQNSIVDYGDDQIASDTEWNSLNDVTSWLDGNQGVEVDDDGNPLPPPNPAAFRILGTSADDVSCHPHVLSPPLMEALLEFMPETLTSDYHFWLKYSLVRDGGGLFQLVKHVRASQYTVLAVETTEGHVFGAFTSQPWRISNQFYGSSNSFLWRLRHSRTMAVAATTASNQHYPNSLLEQAQLETELDVFPVATEHASAGIQGCQLQHGLALGKVTNGIDIMSPSSLSSYALFLRHDLRLGHTSSSDAFKNPCLILEDNGDNDSASDHHTRKIQMFFEVANIEVWTLTPFETESEAEQAELASFFLQDEQRPLNLLSILVHGRDDRIS
jgi:hypothetical protein